MNCPDCKVQIELELIEECSDVDEIRNGILEEPYFKCPKCKSEFEPSDLEE